MTNSGSLGKTGNTSMAPVITLPNPALPTMLCATCRLPILVEQWIVEHVNPNNVFCGAHQPRSPVDPATVAAARGRMAADQAAARRDRYQAAVRNYDPRGGYANATVRERGRPRGCVDALVTAAARYRKGQSAAVVLCGPVGTGKTRAAFALLNDLMHTAEPTPVVRFVDEQTLFEGPHYLAAQTAMRFRRDADVLFVDDVGAAASLAGRESERTASWLAIMKSAAAAPGRFLLVITTNLEVLTPGVDDGAAWGWATGGSSLQEWMGEPAVSRMQHLGPYRDLRPATNGRGSLVVSAGNLDWRPALGNHR